MVILDHSWHFSENTTVQTICLPMQIKSLSKMARVRREDLNWPQRTACHQWFLLEAAQAGNSQSPVCCAGMQLCIIFFFIQLIFHFFYPTFYFCLNVCLFVSFCFRTQWLYLPGNQSVHYWQEPPQELPGMSPSQMLWSWHDQMWLVWLYVYIVSYFWNMAGWL